MNWLIGALVKASQKTPETDYAIDTLAMCLSDASTINVLHSSCEDLAGNLFMPLNL